MSTARTILVVFLSVLAVLLVLAIGASLVITNTDWGRERVRALALDQLQNTIEGEISLGRVEGDLLREVRLIDLAIVDTAGRPFIRADTLSVGYDLISLLRKRIVLSDLRVVDGEIILDRPPGEDWNFVRIFMADPDTTAQPSAWGNWIELRNLTLVNSRITMRAEWEPPPELTGAERDAAVREALAGETRANVVEVPGGYQNVMDFRELNALIDRALVAHPDTAAIPIGVARFSGIVQPFAPPAAIVHDLAGRFRIDGDSLFFYDVDAVLPSSRLQGGGVYAMEHGELLMQLEGAPVALRDLQFLYPPLPDEGGGSLRLALQMRALTTRIRANDIDMQVGESELAGRLDLTMGDTVLVRDTDLRFERLDTRLIADLAPAVEVPRHGELTGHIRLDGTPAAMHVDGDVAFDDAAGGTSRVLARGEISTEDDVRARGLEIRLEPLQAELVRHFAPDAPLRGVIVGDARLDGSMGGILHLRSNLALRDPETGVSRVSAAGNVDMRDEIRLSAFDLRFDPVRLDIVRDQMPDLPPGATLHGSVRLDGPVQRRVNMNGALSVATPDGGTSRVAVAGGIAYGEVVRLSNLRLDLQPLQLDLLRPFAPDIPPGAHATGPVRIDGALDGVMQVDAALAVVDPASGTSRVAVDGSFATEPDMQLNDMTVSLDPLRMELVRSVSPDFPLGGTLSGTARVDGSPSSLLDVRLDLVHEESGERSAVEGYARVETSGQERVDVDVRFDPLSLQTAGRFAPSAGLQGTATGTIRAQGVMNDLRFDADLAFQDGGMVDAAGRLGLGDGEPEYEVVANFVDFDASAISTQAPAATDLSGMLRADGRGSDPATMNASLVAELQGSAVEGYDADEIRFNAELADGLAVVRDARIRFSSADVRAEGSFGLVEGRQGTLTYDVSVDSLSRFADFFPAADTGAVEARPAAREAIEERVVRETEEAARDAEVEFLATGQEPPAPDIDSVGLAPIPRQQLAGRLAASGTVSGNIARLDAQGEVDVEELVFQGNYVESGRARFSLGGVGTDTMNGVLDASVENVLAGGFAFDAGEIEGAYRGGERGTGRLDLFIQQDDATDLRADAEFMLSLDRNELRLQGMALRLDTVEWRTEGMAVVEWAGDGVGIHDLELRSSGGGRIAIDGELPTEGEAALDVDIQDLDIAHLFALLQDDRDASGKLSLQARLDGSLDQPRLEGEASLRDARMRGEHIPSLQLSFDYADQALNVDGRLEQEGAEMATMQGRIPIDLSANATGDRVLDRPMEIEVRADRLSLDALPAFTDQVETARGEVTLNLTLGGSPANPALEGDMALAMERLRIVPLGITLERIAGQARSEGGVMRLDSLVAWSDGPITVSGEIDLATLTAPAFDLDVQARNARVIDSRDARLHLDADLEIVGPMDGLNITGNVNTRRGVIYIPELSEFGATEVVNLDDPAVFERVDTLLVAQTENVAERSALAENLTLEIDVQIDRDVWLRSSEANIEIYTPEDVGPLHVRMNGLQATPTIEGTINTDRGEYEYASRRFTLTRGAVTFTGGDQIDPILQVAAEHEVQVPNREAFNIRIVLSGTMQDPEVILESTAQPPISQSDLLSFLVFGRDASDILQSRGSGLSGQSGSGGGLVGNMAGMATQQYAAIAMEALVSRVESDLARDLGLDVLRITPADLPPELFTGSYLDVLRGTEVEAGSYVIPRLFVAVQARPTFIYPGLRAEYRTRRGFEWTTSWRARYIPTFPTLREREADRALVFGTNVFREWRF